ncbi:hypothetical protein DSL72_006384 [Monilinia vaccinii-corymbosi]|uniref:Uncharacterized protein n=1 Tax=Monilinia vaccinii-corymbosi TaxID=61207 RepID=A0A8A3PNK7_9HELO|nr:hypothetical protein DSL72_006384 [Monilinia vaccinii-corymbosi]
MAKEKKKENGTSINSARGNERVLPQLFLVLNLVLKPPMILMALGVLATIHVDFMVDHLNYSSARMTVLINGEGRKANECVSAVTIPVLLQPKLGVVKATEKSERSEGVDFTIARTSLTYRSAEYDIGRNLITLELGVLIFTTSPGFPE